MSALNELIEERAYSREVTRHRRKLTKALVDIVRIIDDTEGLENSTYKAEIGEAIKVLKAILTPATFNKYVRGTSWAPYDGRTLKHKTRRAPQ